MIIVYITTGSKEEAKNIVKHLLEERLIACANIFPVESMYWWEGKITEGKEFVLICKTLYANFLAIKTAVKKIHSYTTPCILKIEVEPNKEFFYWLEREVK